MDSSTRGKILVVDDEDGLRHVFALALESAGYSVNSAKCGREAIEMSNSNRYHLALIDMRLPDMEGTQLLTAFKNSNPKMRKVIVTGYPSVSNTIEALNRQADGFLVKPVKMEDLLKEVAKQLKEREEEMRYSERKVEEFVLDRIRDMR
jgi:two-component system response regulator GlrR